MTLYKPSQYILSSKFAGVQYCINRHPYLKKKSFVVTYTKITQKGCFALRLQHRTGTLNHVIVRFYVQVGETLLSTLYLLSTLIPWSIEIFDTMIKRSTK